MEVALADKNSDKFFATLGVVRMRQANIQDSYIICHSAVMKCCMATISSHWTQVSRENLASSVELTAQWSGPTGMASIDDLFVYLCIY